MDGKQAQRQEEFQLPAGAKRLHNHEAVANVLRRVAKERAGHQYARAVKRYA